jgi:uncharacterized protein
MATVTVKGRATVAVAPDEAALALGVEAVRPTAAEALTDVAERVERLTALCDELGVDRANRVTDGVSVQEHGEHDRDGQWRHRGYRASTRLRLRTADAALVGRPITEGVERAQASADGPWWEVLPSNPARLEACRLAAADARRRAESYAEALDVRLGAIVAVRDEGVVLPPPRPVANRAYSAAAAEAITVEPGEKEVAATVDVEFQLEQG